MKFTPWWSQPLSNHLSSVGFLQFCNLLQINLVKRCFFTSNLNGVLDWQFTKLRPFLGILEYTFRTTSLNSLNSSSLLKRRSNIPSFRYKGKLSCLVPIEVRLRKSLLGESFFLHKHFTRFMKSLQKPSFRLFNPLIRLKNRRYSLLNERTPFFKDLKIKFSRKMRRKRRFKGVKSLSSHFYRLRRLWIRILNTRVSQTKFSPFRKNNSKYNPNTGLLKNYLVKFLMNQLPTVCLTKKVSLPQEYREVLTRFNKSSSIVISRLFFLRFIRFTVNYFFSKKPIVSYFRRSGYHNSLSKKLFKGILPELKSISSSKSKLNLKVVDEKYSYIRDLTSGVLSQNHNYNTSNLKGGTNSLLFKKYLTEFLQTNLLEPTVLYKSYRVSRQRRTSRVRRIRLPRVLHFVQPHRLRLKSFRASSTFLYIFRRTSLLRRKALIRYRRETKSGPSRINRANIYNKLSTEFHKNKKTSLRLLKRQYRKFCNPNLTENVNNKTFNYTLPNSCEDSVRIWWDRTTDMWENDPTPIQTELKTNFHRLNISKLHFRRTLEVKKQRNRRIILYVSWSRLRKRTNSRQKRLYRRFRLKPLSFLKFKFVSKQVTSDPDLIFEPCKGDNFMVSKLTLIDRVFKPNFEYNSSTKTQSLFNKSTTYLTFIKRRTRSFKKLYFDQASTVYSEPYLNIESFRKLPFILSSTGFMYNPNFPKKFPSQLRSYINSTKYSFFNVLHIKRFILRERTGRPVLRRARYDHDRTSVSPYSRLLENHLSRSFLDSQLNTTILPERKDFISLSQTYTHDPKQISGDFDEYDDYNLRIRRIRFKPGYPRIWREARSSLNQVLNLRFRYQHRLTVHLGRFAQISSSLHRKVLDLKVNNLLIRSRFVFDLFTANNLVSSNLVFVNGLTVSNPSLLLFVGDVVQLIVHVKFYIVYRWLLNWYFFKVQRKSRLARSKFKKVSHAQTKQRSFKLPDWLLRMRNADKDIPKFVEVDFFTLSSFILYTPFCKGDLEVSDLLDSRIEIFNMYNWKYIN